MKIVVVGDLESGYRFYGPVPDDWDDEPTALLSGHPYESWFITELQPWKETRS